MELSPYQQIFDLIKKSGKILILLPENLTADCVASGLALSLFLKKIQKEAEIVSSGTVSDSLKFLPGSRFIKNKLEGGKTLVVTVDTSVKKIEEISYQTTPDKVHIYLKSKNQELTPADLIFSQEKYPVDLIISLGAKSLEDFSKLQENNPDLFFETAKINIDNKADNEYFGAVNLVDVVATSVAEILAELFQKYEVQLVDEDIATCLLTGIITKTQSFQHVQTTPKAFIKASELISLGGRQQEIIKHVYKTKSLSLLKLWGRALAKMKIQEDEKIIYSVLNIADFEKAGSNEKEILLTLKEFVENLSGYKILGLMAEPVKGNVRLVFAAHEQISTAKLLRFMGGRAKVLGTMLGNYRIFEDNFSDSSLEQVEELFISAAKQIFINS